MIAMLVAIADDGDPKGSIVEDEEEDNAMALAERVSAERSRARRKTLVTLEVWREEA